MLQSMVFGLFKIDIYYKKINKYYNHRRRPRRYYSKSRVQKKNAFSL